jgi:hypothetical protein
LWARGRVAAADALATWGAVQVSRAASTALPQLPRLWNATLATGASAVALNLQAAAERAAFGRESGTTRSLRGWSEGLFMGFGAATATVAGLAGAPPYCPQRIAPNELNIGRRRGDVLLTRRAGWMPRLASPAGMSAPNTARPSPGTRIERFWPEPGDVVEMPGGIYVPPHLRHWFLQPGDLLFPPQEPGPNWWMSREAWERWRPGERYPW